MQTKIKSSVLIYWGFFLYQNLGGKELRTKMTNKLVCPYCGAIQERGLRSIENYSGIYFENKCENCEKDFLFKVNIFYSSKKGSEK